MVIRYFAHFLKKEDEIIQTELLMVIFNLVFFVHNIFYISLLEKMFGTKSSVLKIIVFSAVSGTVGTVFLILFGSMSSLGYGIMLAVYVVMVMVYYKGQSLMVRFVCALIFNVQIMVVRGIVVAVISMVSGQSILSLSQDESCFWTILIITAALSALLIAGILRIIPHKYLRAITQKTEQMGIFFAITLLANIYMIANGMVYAQPVDYDLLPLHQIVASLTWLAATYASMFMLVVFDMMREHKENLEQKLHRDEVYKQALLSRVQTVLEINCSKDKLQRMLVSGQEQRIQEQMRYSEYVSDEISRNVYDEDMQKALEHSSLRNILAQFLVGKEKFGCDYRLMQSDGSYRWVNDTIAVSRDAATNDIIAIKTVVDDIHEIKMSEAMLQLDTQYDYLVGAYNRKTTELFIKNHLEMTKTGVMFLLDLDNFKAINDNMGHLYGDEVLKEFYNDIAKNCRKDDIIGRIGGDEFVVFFKNATDRQNIANKAEKICSSAEKKHTSEEGVSVTVSCSIGIAIAPEHGTSYEELYKASDLAMYACKKKAKNGYAFYEPNDYE